MSWWNELRAADTTCTLEPLLKKFYSMGKAFESIHESVSHFHETIKTFWPELKDQDVEEYGYKITMKNVPYYKHQNNEELKEDIGKIITFCQNKKSSIMQTVSEILNYNGVSVKSKKENEDLKEEINKLKKESTNISRSQQTVGQLTGTEGSLTSRNENTVLILEEEIEKLRRENKQWKCDITELCKEKAELQMKLDAASENQQCEMDNKILKTHQEFLNTKATQKDCTEIQQKYEHLQQSNKDIQQKYEQLQQSNKDIQQKYQQLQNINKDIGQKYKHLHESNHALQQHCQNLEQNNKISKSDIQKWKSKSQKLQRIVEKSQSRISELEETHDEMQKSIENLRLEKENALTRLSKMAGNNLSQNNAAIVDLSDPNRPDKLAEKFCEIYDNLWTDALEELVSTTDGGEVAVIGLLLGTLKKIYETAVHDVISYAENVRRTPLKVPLESETSELDDSTEQIDTEEFYKDLQHQKTVSEMMLSCSLICSESYSKKILVHYQRQETTALNAKIALEKSSSKYGIFIVECAKICWLMRLRSPPMHLSFEAGEKFDGKFFKQYTKCGNMIHYLVWPILQLHENGPLLAKGIVQPV